MEAWLFNGWKPLAHVAIVGLSGYVALIFLLRLAGKRTLSKMNAYDMVVTMALGSILTKAMLTKEQSIAETVFAIFLLIAFQFIASWASCRWRWFRQLTSPQPTLLYHAGTYLHEAMKRERISEPEIVAASVEKGISGMENVEAVILAGNGELCVLPKRS